MKSVLVFFALAVLVSATAPDVTVARPGTSTSKVLSATYISAEDIQAHMDAGPGKPPNVRVVSAGRHNVGFSVLRRVQGKPDHSAVHFKVTEVYHVMDGAGTLVTGGTMVNAEMRAPDSREVKLEDGPGASGTSIKGGVSQRVKAGDVVIIPAGVPHWFSEIDGSIAYIVVRFDPDRLVALQ